jgi:hypothetical protein
VTIEIVSFDLVGRALIANVIKACKAGSTDRIYSMIGHKELFFPAHINKVIIEWIINKIISIESIRVWFE